jgi:hypothetical protein
MIPNLGSPSCLQSQIVQSGPRIEVPWPGNHPSQGFHKPRKTMKKQPKLPDADLTKQGKPRQRAPGAGRPNAGRDRNLPRVSPETHALFTEIKETLGFKNLADAIEHAAQLAHKKLSR